MDITWLGHSCFRLHDADMTVVTDPYPSSVGLRVDNRPASVVTVSNTHPNHNNAESIEGDPKIFSDPGEYEYNGVTARGVMTPLNDGQPQEERNVAFTIEIGGINICHLGDISLPMSTSVVGLLLVTVLSCIRTFRMGVKISVDTEARPSLIPSLCTLFTRAGIEWRR